MKETKEILDNILRMKKSEYELLETSVSSTSSKLRDQKNSKKANVLSSEADEVLSSEEALKEMENYNPTQKLDFKVDEIKDCLEKKKKRRNYIEFRPDYEKS